MILQNKTTAASLTVPSSVMMMVPESEHGQNFGQKLWICCHLLVDIWNKQYPRVFTEGNCQKPEVVLSVNRGGITSLLRIIFNHWIWFWSKLWYKNICVMSNMSFWKSLGIKSWLSPSPAYSLYCQCFVLYWVLWEQTVDTVVVLPSTVLDVVLLLPIWIQLQSTASDVCPFS